MPREHKPLDCLTDVYLYISICVHYLICFYILTNFVTLLGLLRSYWLLLNNFLCLFVHSFFSYDTIF